jgi:organic radical activating enzyme
MEYIAGRNNLACTVFVPYDCNNNCPFCTSKWMYRNSGMEMNIDKIIEVIKCVNSSKVITEFVITGGEPTANLEQLKRVVNACEKPVYVNTTLPKNNIDSIIEYINNEEKIRGINISRQFGKLNNLYKFIASPDDISRLRKPVRINVMRTSIWKNELEDFVNTWVLNKHYILNLREDYRYITKENLKTRNDVVDYLAEKYVYLGGNGCMVCNGETFLMPETEKIIHYHRGIEHSCVRYETKTYINDVIVRPDGKVYDDWSFDFELNSEIINNIK